MYKNYTKRAHVDHLRKASFTLKQQPSTNGLAAIIEAVGS